MRLESPQPIPCHPDLYPTQSFTATAPVNRRTMQEMFVAGQYETAAKLYELSLSHWTK